MDTYDLSGGETVEVVEGVYRTRLAIGDRASLHHFHLEPEAAVPEHRHEAELLGFLYTGSLTITVSDDAAIIGPGEAYRLASGEPHAVANEGEDPALGVDLFAPARTASLQDERV